MAEVASSDKNINYKDNNSLRLLFQRSPLDKGKTLRQLLERELVFGDDSALCGRLQQHHLLQELDGVRADALVVTVYHV